MRIFFQIILYDNKKATIESESSYNIETVLFIYYLDRILIAFGERARNFLISELDSIIDGIVEDFTENPTNRDDNQLGAYYLGTDFALLSNIEGKEIFKAKGELNVKNDKLILQTDFQPISLSNGQTEFYALETIHAFLHHLMNKATPPARFILGALIDHTLKGYGNISFNPIYVGIAPSSALSAIFDLERNKKSAWFKDVEKLLND